jgi:hypothetical protein
MVWTQYNNSSKGKLILLSFVYLVELLLEIFDTSFKHDCPGNDRC